MKTLPISEELLHLICLHFLTMEPGRQYLVDECVEAQIFDRLAISYPDLMGVDVSEKDFPMEDEMPF